MTAVMTDSFYLLEVRMFVSSRWEQKYRYICGANFEVPNTRLWRVLVRLHVPVTVGLYRFA